MRGQLIKGPWLRAEEHPAAPRRPVPAELDEGDRRRPLPPPLVRPPILTPWGFVLVVAVVVLSFVGIAYLLRMVW